jgi:hypothetical protein
MTGSGIQLISKPQVRLKGKAPADPKAERTMQVGEHFGLTGNAAVGPAMEF